MLDLARIQRPEVQTIGLENDDLLPFGGFRTRKEGEAFHPEKPTAAPGCSCSAQTAILDRLDDQNIKLMVLCGSRLFETHE